MSPTARQLHPATGFDGTEYPGWSQEDVDEFEAAQEAEREYREGR